MPTQERNVYQEGLEEYVRYQRAVQIRKAIEQQISVITDAMKEIRRDSSFAEFADNLRRLLIRDEIEQGTPIYNQVQAAYQNFHRYVLQFAQQRSQYVSSDLLYRTGKIQAFVPPSFEDLWLAAGRNLSLQFKRQALGATAGQIILGEAQLAIVPSAKAKKVIEVIRHLLRLKFEGSVASIQDHEVNMAIDDLTLGQLSFLLQRPSPPSEVSTLPVIARIRDVRQKILANQCDGVVPSDEIIRRDYAARILQQD